LPVTLAGSTVKFSTDCENNVPLLQFTMVVGETNPPPLKLAVNLRLDVFVFGTNAISMVLVVVPPALTAIWNVGLGFVLVPMSRAGVATVHEVEPEAQGHPVQIPMTGSGTVCALVGLANHRVARTSATAIAIERFFGIWAYSPACVFCAAAENARSSPPPNLNAFPYHLKNQSLTVALCDGNADQSWAVSKLVYILTN